MLAQTNILTLKTYTENNKNKRAGTNKLITYTNLDQVKLSIT